MVSLVPAQEWTATNSLRKQTNKHNKKVKKMLNPEPSRKTIARMRGLCCLFISSSRWWNGGSLPNQVCSLYVNEERLRRRAVIKSALILLVFLLLLHFARTYAPELEKAQNLVKIVLARNGMSLKTGWKFQNNVVGGRLNQFKLNPEASKLKHQVQDGYNGLSWLAYLSVH